MKFLHKIYPICKSATLIKEVIAIQIFVKIYNQNNSDLLALSFQLVLLPLSPRVSFVGELLPPYVRVPLPSKSYATDKNYIKTHNNHTSGCSQ